MKGVGIWGGKWLTSRERGPKFVLGGAISFKNDQGIEFHLLLDYCYRDFKNFWGPCLCPTYNVVPPLGMVTLKEFFRLRVFSSYSHHMCF